MVDFQKLLLEHYVKDYFAMESAKKITWNIFPSPSDENADWRERAWRETGIMKRQIYHFIYRNWW